MEEFKKLFGLLLSLSLPVVKGSSHSQDNQLKRLEGTSRRGVSKAATTCTSPLLVD